MPNVEAVVSKMATNKNRQVRHDWSDQEAEDSMLEHDMNSITSADDQKMQSQAFVSNQQQLQQNSLFSSI